MGYERFAKPFRIPLDKRRWAPGVCNALRGAVMALFGDHPEPPLTLKWRFREHRDGETATFAAAGFRLYVIDMDGDASEWEMRRGDTVIASGGTHLCTPYFHFDACLLEAEAALRAAVAKRKAELVEVR